MKKDFEAILDESLSRLQQKESMESCLGRYPQYTDQLEPLLRTALKVEVLKDTEPPSAKAMATGRERFLREAARLRAERAPAHKLAKGPARRRRFMLSLAAAILIALLLALAVVAGVEVPDTLRQLYHRWRTPGPQPTLTQPATDTPWPTMTPHEVQTLMATRTLYPAESDTPTTKATHTPKPTDTPMPTATPVPPTDTPTPTMTPVPPTDTPGPTMTPVPPTDTPHTDDDADDCDPIRDRDQDQDCTCPDDNCDGGNDDGGDQGDDSGDGDDNGGGGHGGQP